MFSLQFHNLQELRHSASLVTKVFIQRDYSDGTVCRFLTKFPSELDNRVSTQTTKTHTHYFLCTRLISTWTTVRVFFFPHKKIERILLEETVKTLNSYYVEAEKIGGQSYLEGCLACATAYFIFLCMETRYEKVKPQNKTYSFVKRYAFVLVACWWMKKRLSL